MTDCVDILNCAAVAARAGAGKVLGGRDVGLALQAQRGHLVAEGAVAQPAGLPRRCAPRNDRVGARKSLVIRNRDLRGKPADGGGGGVPGNGFDFRFTGPDGSLEAARGEITPEIRNPRVGVTKKVAGLPERAIFRRRMELGSSIG